MFKARMQRTLQNILTQRQQREQGQGLVEYALILVLVAVVVIVILSLLGGTVNNVFDQVNDALGGNIAQSENNSNCTVVNNSGTGGMLVGANDVGERHSNAECTAPTGDTFTFLFVPSGVQADGNAACAAKGFGGADHYDDNDYPTGWFRCF